MSKEMKDFLSQFMNPPATNLAEIIETKPLEQSETQETKIKAVARIEKTVQNPIKIAKKTVFTDLSRVSREGGVAIENFLLSVNNKQYVFDKKKNLLIDDQLFTVLNLLKQHEGVKSVASLLNAIVEKFVEDNKEDLKKILSKNPLG